MSERAKSERGREGGRVRALTKLNVNDKDSLELSLGIKWVAAVAAARRHSLEQQLRLAGWLAGTPACSAVQ